VKIHSMAFTVTTPCSRVDYFKRFERTYCLYLQDKGELGGSRFFRSLHISPYALNKFEDKTNAHVEPMDLISD
jgi:hypothetical protein